MKKVLIVLGLILLATILFKTPNYEIPQFTTEEMQMICIEEEI